MSTMDREIVLITGASSGIGRACAQHLAQRGYRVYGTSRRAPLPPDPAAPGSPVMIRMDVDQDESVSQAVEFILREEGRLDVVVNNAGFGIAGAVEDTSMGEARAQMETNFFGVLRVCRAVLPAMRERRAGLIVNVSSLGGVIALPYQALYSASKFAVEGLTEALRMEVKQFGIRVALLEPGDCSTQFTANRCVVEAGQLNGPYTERFDHMIKTVEADEQGGCPPEKIAHALERIIRQPSPRPRYRHGPAIQSLAASLKGILPGKLFEWLFMKVYGLQ